METEFWNKLFDQIDDAYKSIAYAIHRDTPIQELRKTKRKLNAELPQINEIGSTIEKITANIEQFQYLPNLEEITEHFLDIKDKANKLFVVIKHNTIQHNIDSAILTSINMFRRKIQPVYNKFDQTLDRIEGKIVNYNNRNLIKKFDFFDIQASDKIKSACKTTQILFNEKFLEANNNNQIRKIFREVKKIINEQINIAIKIHLSCLSKIKLLLKSVKKSTNLNKGVFLNGKFPSDSKLITKPSKKYLLDNEIPIKVEKYVTISITVKSEISLKFNWKYRKK